VASTHESSTYEHATSHAYTGWISRTSCADILYVNCRETSRKRHAAMAEKSAIDLIGKGKHTCRTERSVFISLISLVYTRIYKSVSLHAWRKARKRTRGLSKTGETFHGVARQVKFRTRYGNWTNERPECSWIHAGRLFAGYFSLCIIVHAIREIGARRSTIVEIFHFRHYSISLIHNAAFSAILRRRCYISL